MKKFFQDLSIKQYVEMDSELALEQAQGDNVAPGRQCWPREVSLANGDKIGLGRLMGALYSKALRSEILGSY